MANGRWDFQNISDERRANLDAVGSFETLAEQVRDTMEVLCCHQDPCDRAAGFKRPVYTVRVPARVFDLFFNSRDGYRAAYFHSPFRGLAANDHLLRTVAPSLVAAEPPGNGSELDATFRTASLTSLSAKVWLKEQNHFCPRCVGEWTRRDDVAQIANGVWELGTSPHSTDGRSAPCLTKLKLMGAFMNDRGDEFIAERKRRRHFEIHETGWS